MKKVYFNIYLMKKLSNTIGYIYKITSPDNKVYIGQTINLSNRKRKYKYGEYKGQLKLWNSCQKYKWEPLDTFEIIDECLCGENKFLINEREIYWISYYDSYNNGLNCTIGGEGNCGMVISEEVKEKLRIINTGKKHSQETKEKIGKYNKGKILTEETKNKIKKTKLENPYKHSEDMKKHISDCNKGNKKMYGKIHSIETKEKISKSKKGKTNTYASVKIICLNNNKIYNSQKEAANELGINSGHISCVCLGKRKSTGGYKFKYYEE